MPCYHGFAVARKRRRPALLLRLLFCIHKHTRARTHTQTHAQPFSLLCRIQHQRLGSTDAACFRTGTRHKACIPSARGGQIRFAPLWGSGVVTYVPVHPQLHPALAGSRQRTPTCNAHATVNAHVAHGVPLLAAVGRYVQCDAQRHAPDKNWRGDQLDDCTHGSHALQPHISHGYRHAVHAGVLRGAGAHHQA